MPDTPKTPEEQAEEWRKLIRNMLNHPLTLKPPEDAFVDELTAHITGAIRQAEDAAYERAAEACDNYADNLPDGADNLSAAIASSMADDCAEAIRGLKHIPKEGEH